MKTILNCAIYTRVSTDGQAEVEFNSCEAQESKIMSYIKSQVDMEVFKTYSDPGFTGANTNRPALQEMFKDIRELKINLVIAYKIDRLTRSPKDFYQIIEYFEKYEVSFISVTERFDTSTPSGRLLRNIMLTFAQFERELTGERVRDKLLERAQKGFSHGGNAPLGYRKENKRLVIDEEEAKAVKYIFEEFVNRTPLPDIVQGLIARNLKTKEGKVIDKSRVCHTIENPVCMGVVRFKGKSYKGMHEPIISKELFEEAQNINPKRKNGVRHYKICYLAGLVRCPECGSNMTPTHSVKIKNGLRKKYYYYRCTSTYKKSWSVCTTKQISADRLEKYIFSNLERISIDETYIENFVFKMHNAESSKKPVNFEGSPLGSGFELSGVSSKLTKITPTHLGQTLVHFVKELKDKKSIEKHLTAKKFIKNIIYSKEKITINLFLTNICNLHNSAERLPNFLDFSGETSSFSDSFSPKKRPQEPFGSAARKNVAETLIFLRILKYLPEIS